mmetsp:Transcript_29559/g.87560  ORF Transcript_29559/g.87560 Transcript_29559/m.87560 type:complete len:210 (+) Transcript_29559:405-1034(+)
MESSLRGRRGRYEGRPRRIRLGVLVARYHVRRRRYRVRNRPELQPSLRKGVASSVDAPQPQGGQPSRESHHRRRTGGVRIDRLGAQVTPPFSIPFGESPHVPRGHRFRPHHPPRASHRLECLRGSFPRGDLPPQEASRPPRLVQRGNHRHSLDRNRTDDVPQGIAAQLHRPQGRRPHGNRQSRRDGISRPRRESYEGHHPVRARGSDQA